jgi:hypothetical protein
LDRKQTLYQQQGKRLISIYPRDLSPLDSLLSTKLSLFGFHLNANERSEVSAAG